MNNEFNNQDMNQFESNNINNQVNNRGNNNSNFLIIIMVIILILFVFVFIGNDNKFFNNSNNQQNNNNLVDNNDKQQDTNIDNNKENIMQENENNNVDNNKDNNIQENVSDENNYNIFSENLKKEISRYTEYTYQYKYVNDDMPGLGIEYFVELDEKGNLYVDYTDNELDAKYGKYKVADKVLSFYVVSHGNGGGNRLYFINQDGTVGYAETEYGIGQTNVIEVNKNLGYKNIVSIVTGVFSRDGYGGTRGPIFIDINGNIYSENDSLLDAK